MYDVEEVGDVFNGLKWQANDHEQVLGLVFV